MDKRIIYIFAVLILILLAFIIFLASRPLIPSHESTVQSLEEESVVNEKPSTDQKVIQEEIISPKKVVIPETAKDSDRELECDHELIEKVQKMVEELDLSNPYETTDIEQAGRQLKASFEYLSLLGESDLEVLVNQGFRDAMTLRGEQLLNSTDERDLQRGRELLYQAGVLGSAYALAGLSISHYDEYSQALEGQDIPSAKEAYSAFQNTQHLLDSLAPIPKEEDSGFAQALNNDELVSPEAMQLLNEQSLDVFNQKRLLEGLPIIGDKAVSANEVEARAVKKQVENCLKSQTN